MAEAQRACYYQKDYPADLCARLIGSLGPRYVMLQYSGDGYNHLERREASRARHPATLRSYLARTLNCMAVHMGSVLVQETSLPRCVMLFEERELVIDMDLKDWGEHRRLLCACDEKQSCHQCWFYAEMAASLSEVLLQGYGGMLAVFSGGKGCHLWWGSAKVRRLSPEERAQIVNSLLTFSSSSLSPRVQDVLLSVWLKRGILARTLLRKTDSPMATYLKEKLSLNEYPEVEGSDAFKSHQRWSALLATAGKERCAQVIAELGWPRIDKAVTLGAHHTVKTPFAIHARSGKIALPLVSMSSCRPEEMPTVATLTTERLQEARTVFARWLDMCEYPSILT